MIENEDQLRDLELRKYLDEAGGNYSNCCNAPMIEETDICSECGEHSESITDSYENAMYERGEMQRDLEREQND